MGVIPDRKMEIKKIFMYQDKVKDSSLAVDLVISHQNHISTKQSAYSVFCASHTTILWCYGLLVLYAPKYIIEFSSIDEAFLCLTDPCLRSYSSVSQPKMDWLHTVYIGRYKFLFFFRKNPFSFKSFPRFFFLNGFKVLSLHFQACSKTPGRPLFEGFACILIVFTTDRMFLKVRPVAAMLATMWPDWKPSPNLKL